MVFLTVVIDFLRMSSDVYSISDDLQSGNDGIAGHFVNESSVIDSFI